MSNGSAQLDAMIRRIRAIKGLAKSAAPEIATVLKSTLDANISSARGPDGKPWAPTQSGKAPLRNAGARVDVKAVGTVILARLTGVEVRHHRGTARGHVRRQILPTRFIPEPLSKAIGKVLSRRFGEITGGAR